MWWWWGQRAHWPRPRHVHGMLTLLILIPILIPLLCVFLSLSSTRGQRVRALPPRRTLQGLLFELFPLYWAGHKSKTQSSALHMQQSKLLEFPREHAYSREARDGLGSQVSAPGAKRSVLTSSKFTRATRLDFHEAQCGVTTKTRSVDAVPGFFKEHIIRERYR